MQVLHAVQRMQRGNRPLRAQAKRSQAKRDQQQGASSSSLSSSPGLTFSLPPPNTRSTSPSLASTSHACEEDGKKEAGESRRREDEGASTSSARIPQGRHEKNKGGGGGGSSLNLSEFYFYQASDGQLCFVHPFFIKYAVSPLPHLYRHSCLLVHVRLCLSLCIPANTLESGRFSYHRCSYGDLLPRTLITVQTMDA